MKAPIDGPPAVPFGLPRVLAAASRLLEPNKLSQRRPSPSRVRDLISDSTPRGRSLARGNANHIGRTSQ